MRARNRRSSSCCAHAGKYSVAFAARGLGVTKASAAVDPLVALRRVGRRRRSRWSSRPSARSRLIGDSRAVGPLIRLASEPGVDANVRLEAVTALGDAARADGCRSSRIS